MPRKLRIAVSVFFGLLTVALMVLWVRSYWRLDLVRSPSHLLDSYFGRIAIAPEPRRVNWLAASFVVDDSRFDYELTEREARNWFAHTATRAGFTVPYGVIATTAALISGAMGLQSSIRFSLRTMLSITTLVAAVMAMVVWASK